MPDTTLPGGIYRIWLSPDHYYIGRATSFKRRWATHLWHFRRGSHANAYAQNCYNLYATFKPEVLEALPTEEHQIAEQKWLDLCLAQPGCVNLEPSSEGRKAGWHHSEETRRMMSESRQGHVHSVDTKARISAAHTGKVLSEEHRQKMRINSSNRRHSPETKLKIGQSATGRLHSEMAKLKIGQARQGQTHTDEAKLKMRGRRVSAETRALIAQNQTGSAWVCKVGERPKRVHAADLPRYLEAGWERGRNAR